MPYMQEYMQEYARTGDLMYSMTQNELNIWLYKGLFLILSTRTESSFESLPDLTPWWTDTWNRSREKNQDSFREPPPPPEKYLKHIFLRFGINLGRIFLTWNKKVGFEWLVLELNISLFSSSCLSAFLLIDFHTRHCRFYGCFLIGARTTIWTLGEYLWSELSNT